MADKKIKIPRKRVRKMMRGPLFWIVLALVLVVALGKISGSGATYTPVDTSTVLAEISQNKVESALVIDKDQKIQVILKKGETVKEGDVVTLKNKEQHKQYFITHSSDYVNPSLGIISPSSPIGSALLKSKFGQKISLQLNGMDFEYELAP